MSYYFPFGASTAISTQNINYGLLAITASVPSSSTTNALTASFASSVINSPTAGSNGINKTIADCGTSTTSGSKGVQGPTGSKGTDNNSCPSGTIECTGLNVSLSMALPGFSNGINYIRPSGSQFSKVCMEIPVGCTAITAVCPSFLPTASITVTFPAIS